MVENIKYFIRTAKLIKMIPKHIFCPIIDCFSMYVMGVTRVQGVVCSHPKKDVTVAETRLLGHKKKQKSVKRCDL